jgi:hypothetical protein
LDDRADLVPSGRVLPADNSVRTTLGAHSSRASP